MKFTCAKKELSEAISICVHAVSTKSSNTVLEGFLITATEEEVSLTGYNYKTGIVKAFNAQIITPGKTVINAKLFADIIRKISGDTVTFEVGEKNIATISCGALRYDIITLDPSEYPELPYVEKRAGISLPDSLLKEMIIQTVFAVSDNENKPVHTGSLFDVESGVLTMCAVDGYRLSIRRENVTTINESDFNFVVPGETLRDLIRILPDDDESCSIYPTMRFSLFEFADITVITRILEGEFLNYKAAVPDDQKVRLRLNRQELINAVERVSIIISERLKNPVRFTFADTTLRLNCITAMGNSSDEMPIPKVDAPIEIGFNNAYILDALKASTDEEILFEMKTGLAPCTIRPVEGDSYVHLVLPVRLKVGD